MVRGGSAAIKTCASPVSESSRGAQRSPENSFTKNKKLKKSARGYTPARAVREPPPPPLVPPVTYGAERDEAIRYMNNWQAGYLESLGDGSEPPDSPQHRHDTALAFPCAPSTPAPGPQPPTLSTGAIATLRADVIRRGLAGEFDPTSPPVAYSHFLPPPPPPPNRRLNLTVTLQLISIDRYPLGDGAGPRLTVSDGAHTAEAVLTPDSGYAERWIDAERPDRLRPLDCFTVDSAAIALLADTECIFSLYINSHENGTLRPVRYARAIGEPIPVPHIHLGAALPSPAAPHRG